MTWISEPNHMKKIIIVLIHLLTMEPKPEEKVDVDTKQGEQTPTPAKTPKQTQPPIEDHKSLITKIDNRFKTKVIILF